ncbi:MAG: hypothetical protein K0S70_2890 [Microbacterium sp.]|jgi:hypothetical protein|nr:hypothetical protein [Microbacterium sp.]
MKRTLSYVAASVAIGALLSQSAIAGAVARDRSDEAVDVTAQLIENVAPTIGLLAQPVVDQSRDRIAVGATTAPVSAEGEISIAGGDAPLIVHLPREANVGAAQVAADGTIVYSAADGSTVDVAAQIVEEDKLRLQTVISSPDDPHEFTYELGNGYLPVKADDGTYWAYRFDEAGSMDLFRIHDAWARDATGAEVSTHFEIDGGNLIQVVNATSDTVYPVVADPTWEWYSAAYGAGFNKAETRNLANAGAVTGFCGLLPGPFGAACGVVGAQWFLQASLAAQANGCVFIAVVPAPLAIRYESANCY